MKMNLSCLCLLAATVSVGAPAGADSYMDPWQNPVIRIEPGANVRSGQDATVFVQLGSEMEDLRRLAAMKDLGVILNAVRLETGRPEPIMLHALALPAEGAVALDWIAGDFACAPTDAPDWCELDPGDYQIEVLVHTRPGMPTTGRGRGDLESHVVSRIKSAPFTLR